MSSSNVPFHAIGPLYDPVTWYKITHVGEQVAQWYFQNKGGSRWTGTNCAVLEVPLCNLLTSMCDFVPCDRIVQRAYSFSATKNFSRFIFEIFARLTFQRGLYFKLVILLFLGFLLCNLCDCTGRLFIDSLFFNAPALRYLPVLSRFYPLVQRLNKNTRKLRAVNTGTWRFLV